MVPAPGGRLYLVVPFLVRVHGDPHDFFRHTASALQESLRRAGFDLPSWVEPLGGGAVTAALSQVDFAVPRPLRGLSLGAALRLDRFTKPCRSGLAVPDRRGLPARLISSRRSAPDDLRGAMKGHTSTRAGEAGKFEAVVRAFPGIWSGDVLDVGCRSGNLRLALDGQALTPTIPAWTGSPADVVANLEEGLPFPDGSFDVVVALDVLEHTDDIHGAFAELCRVSRRHVVLTLPNTYEASLRLKYLLGKRISGKYGLPVEPVEDRHRWVMSLHEALAFTHAFGGAAGDAGGRRRLPAGPGEAPP